MVMLNITEPLLDEPQIIEVNEESCIYECPNGTYDVYALIIEHKDNYDKRNSLDTKINNSINKNHPIRSAPPPFTGAPPPFGYAIRKTTLRDDQK